MEKRRYKAVKYAQYIQDALQDSGLMEEGELLPDTLRRLLTGGSLTRDHFVRTIPKFGPQAWSDILDVLGLEEVTSIVTKESVAKPERLDRFVLAPWSRSESEDE